MKAIKELISKISIGELKLYESFEITELFNGEIDKSYDDIKFKVPSIKGCLQIVSGLNNEIYEQLFEIELDHDNNEHELYFGNYRFQQGIPEFVYLSFKDTLKEIVFNNDPNIDFEELNDKYQDDLYEAFMEHTANHLTNEIILEALNYLNKSN